MRDGLTFVGHATVVMLRALGHWRSLRPISVARHIYDTGITAIPVVALIAFLISVIIAYMAASQLRNYGADIYVVDLITVGVLRTSSSSEGSSPAKVTATPRPASTRVRSSST